MKLIELKEVCKRFKSDVVLEDVSLTIEEGDILGVIGQSGSGKTTLLNLITGFLEPSSGEVLHSFKLTEGPKNLHEKLHEIKGLIGFAPQHNSFYPQLTVAENLLHFGQLYSLKKETILNNIKGLLKATRLYDDRHKLAEQLSGGMQKRLDIACSLVHKPKILILDEPTADLDPRLQKEIIYFLQEINRQGITLVIASHHLHHLEMICNKVAIIHKSKLSVCGLLEEIKRPYAKGYFTINLDLGSDKEKVLAMLNKMSIKEIIDNGNSLIVHPTNAVKTISYLLNTIEEENLCLRDMDIRRPSLNDIFDKITLEK